ncbi:calcium/calmodulin-dependent protein kinase type IV-like [Cimex lectularius]|uniref:Protein kinase domain-containing protein n=1 Tax=Cimex lectularius TaxID=79782 RepID=A0A8I6RJK7_CIMLE|nr:calcium/calmodulin-dependent protein kinase type IV-like [Cimex lectularius]XP_014244496.1 calcium/calmodulin-dependent protein kinase type IV-like [Cimex lectularius]
MTEMEDLVNCHGNIEDRYILGDIIAKGQFSTVYKCLYKGKTERACRIYNKKDVNKEKIKNQLEQIIKIRHTNLIHIFEGFETKDEVMFLCERITGEELFERIVTLGHYSEVQAAHVTHSILSALECLHSKGIVHGDIRPESLIYQSEDPEAILKLRDVSFASHTPSTYTTVYVAPENEDVPTISGDIWSLGIVLYVMLFGLEPETDASEYIEISPGLSVPSWEDVSYSVKHLLREMLSSKPSVRLSAKEALLHPWVNGESTKQTHMEGAVERLKQFNARRKFRVATKVVLMTQKMSHHCHHPNRTKEHR